MVVYAALGTSRPLSVSTTTTIAILSAAELGQVAPNGSAGELIAASATLAMLVGALLAAGGGGPSRVRRQLHLRTGADRIQVRHRRSSSSSTRSRSCSAFTSTKAGFFRDLLAIVQARCPTPPWRRSLVALRVLALIFALEHFAPRAPAPLDRDRAGDCRVGACWT